jgi:hemerythrin superfamily protein
MSFLDKIASALTPPETEEDRAEARRKVEGLTAGNDWLVSAISHHKRIEEIFDRARYATDSGTRITAMKDLHDVLTAHSVAEETVLYPALVTSGHKVHAAEAYQEQTMAKIQLAELEQLNPNGQEWQDKLEHIRGAVLHHIYEEEKDWFPELVEQADSTLLNARFDDEFDRYMNGATMRTTTQLI